MEDLTFERASELLSYDSETGTIRWKVAKSRRVRAGDVAGRVQRGGRAPYLAIKVDGVEYRAHRIAWLLEKGEWPSGHIDHLDGDGTNNRIANLRDVSTAEGAVYLAHRLAWLLEKGEWPSGQSDQLDGDELNKRIANLWDDSTFEGVTYLAHRLAWLLDTGEWA